MKLNNYFDSLAKKEKKDFIGKLASVLGKSEPSIRSYINGNRNVQPEDAKKISKVTKGKVTNKDLCPKVFGNAA